MDTVKITARARQATGKGGARASRRDGLVPGVLYGPDENIALSVEQRELDRILRTVSSGNAIFDVTLEGHEGEEIKAIIKELQRHPLNERVLHFDLAHIRMDQRVRVHVPVHLHGTAAGVKEGGILEHLTRELELDVIAADIPAAIDVDVSALNRNDSIHVRDLTLPADIHVLNPPEQVVVMVVTPAAEVEEAPTEAVVAPAPGEEAKAAE
jgi:large subunit ribosomal protein L25